MDKGYPSKCILYDGYWISPVSEHLQCTEDKQQQTEPLKGIMLRTRLALTCDCEEQKDEEMVCVITLKLTRNCGSVS